MFTIADIRDIAIQIELNGEKAYRAASKNAAHPLIAEIFTWMADEEKRHARWFESIESDQKLTEEQIELEKMGRQLLQEMVAGQTFSLEQNSLQKSASSEAMLVQAGSFEQDTILFYEFLKGIMDSEDACRQLDKIIEEERRHFEQLEEMSRADVESCRDLSLSEEA
ncbi:MAG: ferritin family protein [Desulfofustis sp.]|nr:ferritin family protein [Desulfofustis sp.]